MSILDVIGEVEEFEGGSSLVPTSFYPVSLFVDGVDVNDRGTPYADLRASVLDGPFKGTEVSLRYHWLSFGKPESKGGGIPLLTNACRVASGKPVDESVLEEFGFVASPLTGDPKEDGLTMRAALKDFYNELDHASRLDFVARFLRVAGWDGSRIILSINCEEGNNGRFYNNARGFYPMNHPKRGMAYLKTVAFPEQAELKAQEDAA